MFILCSLTALWLGPGAALASDLIPPPAEIKPDHPRVLLRSQPSPWAASLEELRQAPRDRDWTNELAQLRGEKSAAAQAMVWLLTGESSAAERAIGLMRSYRRPVEADTFHIYFTLTQFGLAYDWLYHCEAFTPETRAEVRSRVLPLAELGLRFADDHVFHNYIWMSAGGAAIWSLATAGDDDDATRLFDQVRERFNQRLFPGWKYLDGLPSEPMGYWALYVFSPGVLTLLATQSAFETNVVRRIQEADGNWLSRNFENLIQSTLPSLRYIPWGDLQSGPNGGVTRDMAGIVDALTWATESPHGAYFSQRLAEKLGLARFRGDTAIFYFLYTRQLDTTPATPPLSFLAGNKQSGHFIARSGWDEGDTVLAFASTDHFGDHHHYDQGSFTIYRRGFLAVDPPVYNRVRGPQQATDVHNTLLIGGQPQRPVRGQWFKTVEEFQQNLTSGRQLETGDMPFWKEGETWAAAAGQFAQAYPAGLVESCVRQVLFVRPGTIVSVDQIAAPPGRALPEVQWLLQLPAAPTVDGMNVRVTNAGAWLSCRPLLPGGSHPTVDFTSVNTHRVALAYRERSKLSLVQLLEVGDGLGPAGTTAAQAIANECEIEVTVGKATFRFASEPPFAVEQVSKP